MMKVFNHFNQSGDPCPYCDTKDDRQTVLIPIPGTESEDGLIVRAQQVHWDCYLLHQRTI